MPPHRDCFTAMNLPQSLSLPPCMDFFTLGAGPNTDLWRKPPDGDTATAPILYTSLRRPFVIAEVTVNADWEMEWDQGGLVIFAGTPPRQRPPPPSQQPPASSPDTNDTRNTQTAQTRNTTRPSQPPPPYPHNLPTNGSKWVKAGLEFSAGTVNASSVSATSDGADWCLSPLSPPSNTPPTPVPVISPGSIQPTSPPPYPTSVRVKLERIGLSLWIWYQIPTMAPGHPHSQNTQTQAQAPSEISSSWRKLREVTWFFWDVEDKNVHVGVYASRPANLSLGDTVFAAREGAGSGAGNSSGDSGAGGGGNANGLVVEFEDLEIFES